MPYLQISYVKPVPSAPQRLVYCLLGALAMHAICVLIIMYLDWGFNKVNNRASIPNIRLKLVANTVVLKPTKLIAQRPPSSDNTHEKHINSAVEESREGVPKSINEPKEPPTSEMLVRQLLSINKTNALFSNPIDKNPILDEVRPIPTVEPKNGHRVSTFSRSISNSWSTSWENEIVSDDRFSSVLGEVKVLTRRNGKTLVCRKDWFLLADMSSHQVPYSCSMDRN